MERLREQAEVAAARYRVADDAVEVQSAEATAQKAAQVSKVATPTGGRQRRKDHVRRQAAAAGMDVLSWTVSGRQRQGPQRWLDALHRQIVKKAKKMEIVKNVRAQQLDSTTLALQTPY